MLFEKKKSHSEIVDFTEKCMQLSADSTGLCTICSRSLKHLKMRWILALVRV